MVMIFFLKESWVAENIREKEVDFFYIFFRLSLVLRSHWSHKEEEVRFNVRNKSVDRADILF